MWAMGIVIGGCVCVCNFCSLGIAISLAFIDIANGATRDAIDGHEEREKDNVDNGEGPPVFPHALENARLARGARVAKLRWVIAP